MTADTLPATEDATRTEPKREAWKNRWLALCQTGGICGYGTRGGCGQWHQLAPGEDITTCVAWPTRDEAVAFAQETLRVRDDLAYLGPIPVSP